MLTNHTKLKLLLIFHLISITIISGYVRAESNPSGPLTEMRVDELESLSLEDLLSTRLTSVSVLGLHHTHPEGEWMLGYRHMVMGMDGNRRGTGQLSDQDVLKEFMITPTNMTMQMHMVHLMYAPSDHLTLMTMASYMRSAMDHLTRKGGRFTTEAEGVGDLKVMGLFTFFGDIRQDSVMGNRIIDAFVR